MLKRVIKKTVLDLTYCAMGYRNGVPIIISGVIIWSMDFEDCPTLQQLKLLCSEVLIKGARHGKIYISVTEFLYNYMTSVYGNK